MQFQEGNTFGKGRPPRSKGKLNRETLFKLLDRITEDFDENYNDLTTNQKIKLLTSFKAYYVEERSRVNIQGTEASSIPFKDLVNAIKTA